MLDDRSVVEPVGFLFRTGFPRRFIDLIKKPSGCTMNSEPNSTGFSSFRIEDGLTWYTWPRFRISGSDVEISSWFLAKLRLYFGRSTSPTKIRLDLLANSRNVRAVI